VLTRNGHGQGKVTTADGQEAPRPPLSVLCRAHKFFRVADTVFRIPKKKKNSRSPVKYPRMKNSAIVITLSRINLLQYYSSI